ncbi:MAG: hypothetical protein RLZZ156_1578 [Deinococcota bacterium]
MNIKVFSKRKDKKCYSLVMLSLIFVVGCVPNTQFSTSYDPDWARKIFQPSESQLKTVCDLGFDSKKLYKAGSVQIETTQGTFKFQSVLGYWYQRCADAASKGLGKPRPFFGTNLTLITNFQLPSFQFRESSPDQADTQIQILNNGSVTANSLLFKNFPVFNKNLTFENQFLSGEFVGDEIRFYIGLPSSKIFLSIRRSEYDVIGQPLSLRQ